MTIKPKAIEAAAAVEGQAADVANKGFEATVSSLKDGMTRATAGFADTQAKVKEGMEKAMKTAEELVAFGQGNVEAIMRSGQIWAAESQAISKTMATTAQTHLDQTMSAWKALTTVKSLKEAADLRGSLAQRSVQTAFAEAGKLTDATMRLAEQTMAPIVERFTLVTEKFTRPAD